jgi:regulator of protease activity HflC (stomatin/prohibitin superfamily)
MRAIYLAGVRYTRQQENGDLKRVTEMFIVPAISFTDVETKLFEEMETRTKGEFSVVSIKKTNYEYVLTSDDGGLFYHVVVSYKNDDEEKKKTFKLNFLIETSDIEKVNEIVNNVLKESIAEYKIVKVAESPVMHVIEEVREEL